MTRGELEAVIWRELSTMVTMAAAADAILIAADSYALTECEKTIEAAS